MFARHLLSLFDSYIAASCSVAGGPCRTTRETIARRLCLMSSGSLHGHGSETTATTGCKMFHEQLPLAKCWKLRKVSTMSIFCSVVPSPWTAHVDLASVAPPSRVSWSCCSSGIIILIVETCRSLPISLIAVPETERPKSLGSGGNNIIIFRISTGFLA